MGSRSCQCGVVAFLLGLLVLGGARVGAQTADEAAAMFRIGKAQYDAGDYESARRSLQAAFRQAPGDMDINFHLGLAAAALGDHETASMAFDRILMVNPDLARVRLELAKSFFQLELFSLAERHFSEVLKQDLPANVKTNIDVFMKRIRQAQKVHFFGGTLRLTGAYDTNARVSPVDDVTVGGLTATIPVERDTYLSQALSLRHEYRLPHTRHTWATQFVNSNSLYSSQTDLELNYFSLETGPRLDFESWALGLRGTARHVSKDYSDYLRSFGGAATLTAPVTERVWLSVDVAGEDRKYYGNRENTGTNVLCAAGPTMAWGRNTLGLSVGYEVNWAARDFESYDRLICDLQYRRGFRYGISMQLGYRYARSLFDSPDIAYSFSRRKDHVHECSVMLRKSLVRSLALEVGHTYSKSTSSVGLYDYGRQVTSLSLSYDF